MERRKLLQEIKMHRFEEAYEGWDSGSLNQEEAALILEVCPRTFRRYICRYEEGGFEGQRDRRLEVASARRAPVDEVLEVREKYSRMHQGWSVSHFYSWYKRGGDLRSYTWVKDRLQEAGMVRWSP